MRVPDLDWAPDLFDDGEPAEEGPFVLTPKLLVLEEGRPLWPAMSAIWSSKGAARTELSIGCAA